MAKRKTKLAEEDINTWAKNNWCLYAADWIDEAMLRLYVNVRGTYRVTHGGKKLFEGVSVTRALKIWEEV